MNTELHKKLARVIPMGRTAPPVTDESIASAKAYQQIERAKAQQAGVTVEDDDPREGGSPCLVTERATASTVVADTHAGPRTVAIVACLVPGCLHVYGGSSEAEAFTKLERHLVATHGAVVPQEVA